MSNYQIPFKYAELFGTVRYIINLMKRDFVEFAKFGITESAISELMAKVIAIENSQFDGTNVSKQMVATACKTELLTGLKDEIRLTHYRAFAAFDKSDPRLTKFRQGSITLMTDLKLLQHARNMLASAKQYSTELSACGQNAVEIERFESLCQQTEIAIQQQAEMKANRIIETKNRRKATSEIYQQLVKFSKLGKFIWRENEPYRNDYDLPKRKKNKDKTDCLEK